MFAFAAASNTHGELSAEEAQRLAQNIKQDGLSAAIEQVGLGHRDRIRRLILDAARGNVVELTDSLARDRILDFGCGYGGISRRLADSFKEVYALDGSCDRLSVLSAILAQDKATNVIPVFHTDALNLPFADASFDVVLLVGVFEYLPTSAADEDIATAHDRCLAEFKRVLRPTGRLIIGTHNRFGWPYLMGATDHGGYPFRQILPRPLERVVAKTLRRSQCRLGYYSPFTFVALARRRFKKVTLYWPWPGYQMPEMFARVDDDADMAQVVARQYCGPKQAVLQTLSAIGLLRYTIPSYYAVCEVEK